MTETTKRAFLTMLGHARGKRSPLTCQLKCGNACAGAECNTSPNGYCRDIASAALSRRSALGLGAAAAVTISVVGATPEAATTQQQARHEQAVDRRQEQQHAEQWERGAAGGQRDEVEHCAHHPHR